MIPVSREISDLKGEFEGGTSFSIDWYQKMRQGAEQVLDNINPETLKRQSPIYGGLTRSGMVYYCPPDVEVPSRLFTNDRRRHFDYVPALQFYEQHRHNVFTIEYVNGSRFIIVRGGENGALLTIDDATQVGTKTGVPLQVNSFNVLPGAHASLQGTFTDVDYSIIDTYSSPLDITAALRGVAILPIYVDEAADIDYVRLILKDDDDNLYTIDSTQDSVGDYFRDGQNMVRFWINNAVVTGAPNPANINSWEVQVKMKTGKSQTVIFGKMTLQQSHIFTLEYYSNRMFIDGTTGAWKDTPASGDFINLNRDAIGILHFETCRLVVQAVAFDRIDGAESQRFDTNLARKYSQYYLRFPSSEQPQSYSLMPDIPISTDFWGVEMADRIGSDLTAAELSNGNVQFADNEVPSGIINGSNAQFNLSHAPNPSGSLMVWLNDQPQTQGVDYTLVGSTITFAVPPPIEYVGAPFVAFYRYTSI